MYPQLRQRDDILKMLDEMIETRKKILDTCSELSSDQLNDPVYPGTWSVLKNLAHLAWAERYMLAFMRTRPAAPARESLAPEPPLDLPALRTALDEAHAEAIAYLKANPESMLAEKCVYGRSLSDQTVGGVYFHLIEHEIGHRAFILHKLNKLQAAK